MANNKDSESEENNDNPTSGNNVTEGLSAEEAAKVDYDEAEVWKKSQKPLYIILGTIFFIIGGYYYYDNSQISEQSERSYRFLSANIDSEGAEKRFLSFAKDYDDKLGGVAFYRAAIIQYKDKRYAEAAKNWLNSKNIKDSSIVLYGESLGTAVAVDLASSNKFAGVILESPFTSMEILAQKYYPYLPAKYILKDNQI